MWLTCSSMEYHLIVINLFNPWLSGNQADPSQTDVHTLGGRSIREIGTLARARLETLVRLYYLRHSFEATDVLLILFLLMLGSISIRVLESSTPATIIDDTTTSTPTTTTPTATTLTTTTLTDTTTSSTTTTTATTPTAPTREQNDASTFLLCAKGLHDQGRNHYIGALMFEMLAGLVKPGNESLRDGLERVRAEFEGIEVREEYVHMEWPVERWILGGREVVGVVEGEDDGGDGV